MGVSSVLLCRECTAWQWLLVTVSLLTCFHLSTSDYITMKSVPPQVASGENVLLLVYNLPEDLLAFAWFKGVTGTNHGIALYGLHKNLSVTGPGHSGREIVYHNGSLLIQNVNEMDTGFYTLRTISINGETVSITTMHLHVYPFLWTCGRHTTSGQPTIELVPPRIAEGGSVLLRIHNPPENIIAFGWFKWVNAFRKIEVGQYIIDRKSSVWGPAYSGRETLYSDGSLLLHGVTQKDLGLYTLRIVRTDLKSEIAHVKINVDTFLSPLTSSQLMIQSIPRYPAEGESILLQAHNLPEYMQAFSWYKSKYRSPDLKIVEYRRAMNSVSWGPEHRRRKWMVYNNGSLMLQDVTEKDAGMYRLEVLSSDFKIEKASMDLYVKKPVTQPLVQIIETTVTGHRSVIFSCISLDTDVSVRWILNNQSLPHLEGMTLSPTKCGLRIDPFRSEDAGEYKCEVSNQVSLKTSLPVFWS